MAYRPTISSPTRIGTARTSTSTKDPSLRVRRVVRRTCPASLACRFNCTASWWTAALGATKAGLLDPVCQAVEAGWEFRAACRVLEPATFRAYRWLGGRAADELAD